MYSVLRKQRRLELQQQQSELYLLLLLLQLAEVYQTTITRRYWTKMGVSSTRLGWLKMQQVLTWDLCA